MHIMKSQRYSSEQLIIFSNTFLLLLVAIMCGFVIYEISTLDQRFVNVPYSPSATTDVLAVNLDNPHESPFWMNVNDGISVYSAFYEMNTKDDKQILILGSSSFKNEVRTEDLRCLIDYGEDAIDIERVDYKVVADYSTIFLYCHVKEEVPKNVALISYANTNPNQWMQVETIPSRMETDSKLAACVQPVKGNDPVEEIARFVDFYEMIGVDHFYFYVHEATEDLIDFNRYLKGSGHSIDVLPWNKDVYFGVGPWSEHVQDCLHRAMYNYRNVITVDVLDFFVPEENARLFDMLMSYKNLHGIASNLQLSCTNFCKDPNPRISTRTSGKNILFRGISQLSDSNYILVPGLTAGILFKDSVTTTIKENAYDNLPESYGIVHRYRKYCDTSVTLDSSTTAKFWKCRFFLKSTSK